MTDEEIRNRFENWLKDLYADYLDEIADRSPEKKAIKIEEWLEAAGNVWMQVATSNKFPTRDDLKRYLYTVLKNNRRDREREKARENTRRKKRESAFDPDRESDSPDQPLRRAEFNEEFVEPCLQLLDERERRMFEAKVSDGEKTETIAQREGMTYHAANKAISRARQKVRRCLLERGWNLGELP